MSSNHPQPKIIAEQFIKLLLYNIQDDSWVHVPPVKICPTGQDKMLTKAVQINVHRKTNTRGPSY